MKLGIGSYSLPLTIAEEGWMPMDLLRLAHQMDAQVVQFCENLSLLTLDEAELAEMEEMARSLGIGIEVGDRGIDSGRLRQLATLAERFGSTFVRLVIDRGEDEPSQAEAFHRLAATRPIWESSGIRLAIENHDRFPAANLRKLVEDLGADAFSICLDTANSLGALEGLNEVVASLGELAINLHIKDVRALRMPSTLGLAIEGRAAGEGQIDIPGLLTKVKPVSAIIECWSDSPPAEQAMLETGWRYLYGLIREGVTDPPTLPG